MDNYVPTLLVLGTKTDPHVERVVKILEARGGINIFVLDYHAEVNFSLEVSQHGVLSFCVNESLLPDRYLVWDRRKIIPGTELYLKGDETSTGYAAQEWRAFYTLLSGLNSDRVVNSQDSKKCLIKPYQQTIAAKSGFLVPPTLVSNDKRRVLNFMSTHDNTTIMKSLSAGKVKPAGEGEYIPYNVMTMRVSLEDIEAANAAEIAYCPHFFQKEIKKSYELRVVVVDDQILPFRIDSQDHKISEVDWRKGIDTVKFSKCELDHDLSNKILSFMKSMGLFFGSFDFMVDSDGRTWFLECNEDGAWGWLDDIVQGAVGQAFADGFLRRLAALSPSSSKLQQDEKLAVKQVH